VIKEAKRYQVRAVRACLVRIGAFRRPYRRHPGCCASRPTFTQGRRRQPNCRGKSLNQWGEEALEMAAEKLVPA